MAPTWVLLKAVQWADPLAGVLAALSVERLVVRWAEMWADLMAVPMVDLTAVSWAALWVVR